MHRILLLGDPQSYHVAGALCSAAKELGHVAAVCDVRQAVGNILWHKVCWHFLDRRAGRQRHYEKQVLRLSEEFQPTLVVATGGCPVRGHILAHIQRLGVPCVNFLTDDPYSVNHRSNWFLRTLPQYDIVFSPRRKTFTDLVGAGCRRVEFLPFGYNPEIHYPEGERNSDGSRYDIVFVGGADEERVPFIYALADSNIRVAVFGGYWAKHSRENLCVRGIASPEVIRRESANAKAAVILVRRANRDGHVMRTFEAAACASCMLVEDTSDHRELFGGDGEVVSYFSCPRTLVAVAQRLLAATEEERKRMADAAYRSVVIHGNNSYMDRLSAILSATMGGVH